MAPATGSDVVILGIESSCDDTAAAVLERRDGRVRVLASVVLGQTALHALFGGVVPEIAARAHAERLDLAVEQALDEASVSLGEIGVVAVTAGPGLIGGLVAGVATARAIGAPRGIPVIGVNHLAGHALSPLLTGPVSFPFLMLLVSGGHCQFLIVHGANRFSRLGGTIDDAPGEAFDKVARLLGLPQPGGPAVEAAAERGDPGRFALPRPLLDRDGLDLSFSGLKTAVLRQRDILAGTGLRDRDRADLCAGFQSAVTDVLANRSARALRLYLGDTPADPTFCVAGGVASNQSLRKALSRAADAAGVCFIVPPPAFCTDNAAMIALAGLALHDLGQGTDFVARPRWPLDVDSAPMLGSGRKGAKA